MQCAYSRARTELSVGGGVCIFGAMVGILYHTVCIVGILYGGIWHGGILYGGIQWVGGMVGIWACILGRGWIQMGGY